MRQVPRQLLSRRTNEGRESPSQLFSHVAQGSHGLRRQAGGRRSGQARQGSIGVETAASRRGGRVARAPCHSKPLALPPQQRLWRHVSACRLPHPRRPLHSGPGPARARPHAAAPLACSSSATRRSSWPFCDCTSISAWVTWSICRRVIASRQGWQAQVWQAGSCQAGRSAQGSTAGVCLNTPAAWARPQTCRQPPPAPPSCCSPSPARPRRSPAPPARPPARTAPRAASEPAQS